MNDDLTTKRKLLSAVCHGSIFFSSLVVSIAIPIVILFISDDEIVQKNAKESLNFHLNMIIFGAISGVLTFILIGFVFLGILFLVSLIMPIIAIIAVLENPDKHYRYPFIFHIL